jgi:hypothetical protein
MTNAIHEILSSLDARIERSLEGPLSLDPRPRRATLLVSLARALGQSARAPRSFESALARVAESQLDHFPGNIFWDFDAFAAHLATLEHAELDETVRISVDLMGRFGMRSPIRFRYVHDFMYGFDWARWVKRKPEERRQVPPFGLAFLRYSHERGGEMLALIADDDAKYPRLGEEVVARNPFGFLREPPDEARLLRHLAGEGSVPVRAWEMAPGASWEHEYSERRAEAARALGLGSSGGDE